MVPSNTSVATGSALQRDGVQVGQSKGRGRALNLEPLAGENARRRKDAVRPGDPGAGQGSCVASGPLAKSGEVLTSSDTAL